MMTTATTPARGLAARHLWARGKRLRAVFRIESMPGAWEAAAVAAVVMTLRLLDPGWVEEARLRTFDAFQRLSPRAYTPAPVRVVDIDDRSLTELGQWPWPRRQVAALIDRLAGLGAASIAFDVVFAEPDRLSPSRLRPVLAADPALAPLVAGTAPWPDYDQELADTARRHPVVFGLAPAAAGSGPQRTASLATLGGDPLPFILGSPGAVRSLAQLEDAAAGYGSIGVAGDRDGIIRRLSLLQAAAGTVHPSLAVEALRVAQGVGTLIARTDTGDTIGGLVEPGVTELKVGAVRIPTDAHGRMWLHAGVRDPARTIPAWRILARGPVDADVVSGIAGSIVLVGTSAAGLKDLRATPLDPFAAGVEVQAQAVEQMVLGHFLVRPRLASSAELGTAVALAILTVVALAAFGAGRGAVAAAILAAMPLIATWIAFDHFLLLIDPIPATAAVILAYATASLRGHLRSERERSRIRHAFTHYLAPGLVARLAERPDALALGGESRELTFLFTDLAGFSSFAERCDPTRLVDVLNRYLEAICEVVIEHGGTIDKIVGDAVHVMFNAPLDQPDHAARAVRCALAIDARAGILAAELAAEGVPLGVTRIGVNTGRAVVGNFGGTSRFDYTAHGDAVNTAARLESVNKHLGTRICVAATTAALCPEIRFRQVGELVLYGKSVGTLVTEPLAANADLTRAEAYARAFTQMEAIADDAAALFADLHELQPDDPLTALHHRRLQDGQRGGRIVLESK